MNSNGTKIKLVLDKKTETNNSQPNSANTTTPPKKGGMFARLKGRFASLYSTDIPGPNASKKLPDDDHYEDQPEIKSLLNDRSSSTQFNKEFNQRARQTGLDPVEIKDPKTAQTPRYDANHYYSIGGKGVQRDNLDEIIDEYEEVQKHNKDSLGAEYVVDDETTTNLLKEHFDTKEVPLDASLDSSTPTTSPVEGVYDQVDDLEAWDLISDQPLNVFEKQDLKNSATHFDEQIDFDHLKTVDTAKSTTIVDAITSSHFESIFGTEPIPLTTDETEKETVDAVIESETVATAQIAKDINLADPFPTNAPEDVYQTEDDQNIFYVNPHQENDEDVTAGIFDELTQEQATPATEPISEPVVAAKVESSPITTEPELVTIPSEPIITPPVKPIVNEVNLDQKKPLTDEELQLKADLLKLEREIKKIKKELDDAEIKIDHTTAKTNSLEKVVLEKTTQEPVRVEINQADLIKALQTEKLNFVQNQITRNLMDGQELVENFYTQKLDETPAVENDVIRPKAEDREVNIIQTLKINPEVDETFTVSPSVNKPINTKNFTKPLSKTNTQLLVKVKKRLKIV
ncbi:hypothetical protein J2Z62_000584 [Mycoplasmoides fastidiosum]|uniref:Uncharacterized protein n=1 Tax=Mycoplasmoides fastidiosum TaxID=92758 RepID=A0ABU0LZL3_9BACT|nr:hypothetical protein [Mycoplasmoides fastidiosum]MDQ0514146.1 hypothetical protein [Mycoplasmoides fastidiosum]UUD37446.1 hypothetical protein NPA10_02610 [Mycoplasmoides fastidiosum]